MNTFHLLRIEYRLLAPAIEEIEMQGNWANVFKALCTGSKGRNHIAYYLPPQEDGSIEVYVAGKRHWLPESSGNMLKDIQKARLVGKLQDLDEEEEGAEASNHFTWLRDRIYGRPKIHGTPAISQKGSLWLQEHGYAPIPF